MSTSRTHDTLIAQRVLCAYSACLSLGVALLAWGVAPAVIERTVTGQAPQARTLLAGSVCFLLGGVFVGLYRLIRRGARRAIHVAFGLSMLLLTAAVAVALITRAEAVSSFVLILAGLTSYTSWAALHAYAQIASARRDHASSDVSAARPAPGKAG